MSQDTDVTAEMDTERAEAFGGRMVQVFNDGCLSLMTSIGHQVGLFDTMAGLPPSTSEDIARAAGLDDPTRSDAARLALRRLARAEGRRQRQAACTSGAGKWTTSTSPHPPAAASAPRSTARPPLAASRSQRPASSSPACAGCPAQ